jgi:hypothetical protein
LRHLADNAITDHDQKRKPELTCRTHYRTGRTQ